VFQFFSFVVNLLPAVAHHLMQEELDQSMPPQDPDGKLSATLARKITPVRIAPCWTLMIAYPQANQPTMSHLGPQWNAARSTHHRVAWLAPLWQYLGEYEPLSRQRLFNAAAVPRQGLFVSLYVVLPVLLIGVPTLMMGLSFAYLQRAVQTDLAALGRRIGWLQTANIAGSMLGAMVTGILLLDWFGTTGTLRLLTLCSIVFLGLLARTSSSRRTAIGAMVSAAAVLARALRGAEKRVARPLKSKTRNESRLKTSPSDGRERKRTLTRLTFGRLARASRRA